MNDIKKKINKIGFNIIIILSVLYFIFLVILENIYGNVISTKDNIKLILMASLPIFILCFPYKTNLMEE